MEKTFSPSDDTQMRREPTSATPLPGKVDLSAYDNSWYQPGPKWKIVLWAICNIVFVHNHLPIPVFIKVWILRLFGAQIGKSVMIKPGVNIKYPWLLFIENSVWIGEDVWIDNLAIVKIGANACLSQGAMLLTGNHDYRRQKFDLIVKPITLETGVWIGAQSVVCPGVVCHSHAVLAVGSVATKALDAYGIYQGNPAVKVRTREINA
jgi:putative colanic acid biosynthesis acetyltransferase WcaF